MPGSITNLIDNLRAKDPVAAGKLWENYFRRLVNLARKNLRAAPRRAADEEDVALSAFDSFIRGAEQGRFPQLDDRHDLWRILLVITQRKAIDLIQHEGREKRDWRRVQQAPESDLCADLAGREPDPALAAQLAEEYQRLLSALADERQRLIAVRKLDGYTNEQIAAQIGCALVTVERELRLIRREWKADSVVA
jgi:RNA polymerase sigma factor (sigma-70 family)